MATGLYVSRRNHTILCEFPNRRSRIVNLLFNSTIIQQKIAVSLCDVNVTVDLRSHDSITLEANRCVFAAAGDGHGRMAQSSIHSIHTITAESVTHKCDGWTAD